MEKIIIIFILIIIFLISLGISQVKFNYIEPKKAVEKMDPGWNLGNSLDAIPDETSWGNPPVQAYIFDDIKKIGFRSVRIPITWIDHLGPSPDYNVDKAWMDRVEEVVNMALERDLWVIINVHHDSWRWLKNEMMQDKENTIKKLEKLWAQIADRFKNYSEKLIFEIINEPGYDGYSEKDAGEIQNEVNERILKIIRSSGGYNDKRLVVVPPLWTDIYMMEKYFKPPKDSNIIIGIHYYSPWDFTANWWGRKNWGTTSDVMQMEKDIKIAYDKFIDYAIIIGEYGLFNGNKPAEWFYYDNLIRIAKKYNMATFYWDNGENYDRRNRFWRDEMSIKIIINASKGIPNSFINPGILFVKEDEPLKDKVIDLILNGNKFLDIYYGEKKLEKNIDYLLQDNKVIINASFLRKILELGKYGTCAILSFKFDKGAEYPLEIVKYKNPVLLDKDIVVGRGVPVNLKLYVNFNGTRLCAIKIIGEKDGKPIRDSWTPYLRGWDDFEVKDMEITIKKHVVEKFNDNVKVTLEFFPEGVYIEAIVRVK
jgi:endoglucanase